MQIFIQEARNAITGASRKSKEVARDLFNSAYVKCNTTNTPSAYPALVIARLQSKLGTMEISIITTILHEGPMELKHKAISLKSLSSPAAEPGQEDGVSCGYPLDCAASQRSKSQLIQPVYPCFTFAAEKIVQVAYFCLCRSIIAITFEPQVSSLTCFRHPSS